MQLLTKTTALVATLSLSLLLLAGCRKTEGDDTKADASASTTSASAVSSATLTSSDAGGGTKAKIGAVALADFSLDNISELDKAMKPLGWKQIMGCGQATFVGRAVTCTYGERPASVKIERKLPVKKKKKNEGTYEIGPYTYANAVLVTAGTTSLIITAGFEGKIADAQAILDAIYDKSNQSIGGKKITSIADDKALDEALKAKVFTGNRSSSSFSVEVALRKASISTHVGDTITPGGAKLEDATGARIGVEIEQKNGTDPAGEKKLLDAVITQ